MYAGYTHSGVNPGTLSELLLSVLRDLPLSDSFYAREGLITTESVMNRMLTSLRSDVKMVMVPELLGNDRSGDVVLVPIRPQ